MATTHASRQTEHHLALVLAQAAVVGLTIATAAIHATLGGLLFTLNAVGYGVLAVALVAPGPLANVRWLIRLALLGFTSVTIGGWILFGARYDVAYADKAIEAALVALLLAELWAIDRGPIAILRRARRLVMHPLDTLLAR